MGLGDGKLGGLADGKLSHAYLQLGLGLSSAIAMQVEWNSVLFWVGGWFGGQVGSWTSGWVGSQPAQKNWQ